MDKLKLWIQDRKNLPIVGVGFLIVLALAALVVLKTTGKLGGGDQSSMQMPGMEAGQTTGDPSGSQPVPGQPVPGQPIPGMPADGSMTPEMGGPAGPGVGQPAPPAAPAAEVAKQSPMLPYRKDPFRSFAPPPTKADMLASVLPNVRHVRLAPAPVRPVSEEEEAVATETLPPQPFRRMAGVLYNGQVAAILETNGEAEVVYPGKEISKGNSRVRVESIHQDHLFLTTQDTKKPMTIKVNMAGSTSNQGQGGSGGAMQPDLGPPM